MNVFTDVVCHQKSTVSKRKDKVEEDGIDLNDW